VNPQMGGPGEAGFGGFAEAFGDIFSDIFGGGQGRGRSSVFRGADLRYNLEISLEQAARGTETKIRIPTMETCEACKGSGAKPGTSPKTCETCHGSGTVRLSQGFFSIQQTCPTCHGTGKMITDPCATCRGAGRLKKHKTLAVKIPAGVDEGDRIRLAGEGEAGVNGGPAGDLYVVTRVEESPVFRRKGDNLEVEVPITVTEAIRGADVEVPTLHGTKKLRVPGGTKSGTVQRLRGEGPQKLSDRARGDIHYRFVIDVPKDLSPEQEEALDGLSRVMNGDPRATLLRDAKKAAT